MQILLILYQNICAERLFTGGGECTDEGRAGRTVRHWRYFHGRDSGILPYGRVLPGIRGETDDAAVRPILQQIVDEIASDKTGTAGYQDIFQMKDLPLTVSFHMFC